MANRRSLLIAMFQGGGNIPQLLPIVARLIALGHQVRVLVGPGVRHSRLPVSAQLLEALQATGAEIVRLREPDAHPLDARPYFHGAFCGWTPNAFRSVAREAQVQRWLPHWTNEVFKELNNNPTDVLVADYVLVGALVAAEAAGIPAVALFHTLSPRPVAGKPPYGPGWEPAVDFSGRLRDAAGTFIVNHLYANNALPPLNQARINLGLPPLREYFAQYDRAARVVMLMNQHFDFPTCTMPANVRLVGTPLDNEAPTFWRPPWPKSARLPRLLVSLSTLDQGQVPLMERILEALTGLPMHAVVTLGPTLASSRFTVPSNVVLEKFISHAAVLPHVDAMVTQCGLGSVMKALAHSVPLVCIPLVGDQPDNAARVTARGAGVRVPADAPPARIREAIVRVVTEPNFRQAAHAFAIRMAGENAVQAAVDEIILVTDNRDAFQMAHH